MVLLGLVGCLFPSYRPLAPGDGRVGTSDGSVVDSAVVPDTGGDAQTAHTGTEDTGGGTAHTGGGTAHTGTADTGGETAHTGGETAHTGTEDTGGPAIRASGVFEVRGTYRADLDDGRETVDPGISDLWWHIISGTERYLEPYGLATATVVAGPVGYVDCAAAMTLPDPIDASDPYYTDLPVGTWLCVRTGDGRISAIEVVAVDAAYNHMLTLAFTTWE